MEPAIRIEGLTKHYYNRTTRQQIMAVDSLSLEVHPGEIFGFLGPNGAGKTTTIKMLLGLIFPNGGDAFILGKPIGDASIKHQIAYLPESPYFYEYLTGAQVLDFYARLFGMKGSQRKKRVIELLDLVGLSRDGDKTLRNYSKGMLQRIGIAQSLINDPDLLFLDEPTSGLDPLARVEIRDLIGKLKQQGKTVFLSSHQLLEVEVMCDRISILNRGKLLKQGKLDELLPSGSVDITVRGSAAVAAALEPFGLSWSQPESGVFMATAPTGDPVDQIVDAVRAAGGSIVALTPQRRTLEQIFVDTIGGVNN